MNLKNMAGLWVIILIFLFASGCSADKGRELTDRSGRAVVIQGPVNRIISTAPSNTEIITDLGMAGKLVAVDRHSANVTGIPDGLVMLDFFYPDAEVIINLKPDLIIASGHNPTGSGEDPFAVLREAGIPVAYIPMSASIEDIYLDIAFIADMLDVKEKGEGIINSMREQIEEISTKAKLNSRHYSVYFEFSAAPEMMTFGKNSFINDMIAVIGARNIFENENWLVTPGAESIIERNPDVILTNVNYIDDPAGEIKSRPGFNHINAVINNRIFLIDNDSSVRPSPRIVLALRQMADAVYSEWTPPAASPAEPRRGPPDGNVNPDRAGRRPPDGNADPDRPRRREADGTADPDRPRRRPEGSSDPDRPRRRPEGSSDAERQERRAAEAQNE